jgi:uncharacterized membrane protein
MALALITLGLARRTELTSVRVIAPRSWAFIVLAGRRRRVVVSYFRALQIGRRLACRAN